MCVRVGANTWISPRRVHTSLQLDRLITRDPLVTDTCLGVDIHCIRVGYSSSFHRMGDIQTRPFSKNYRFVFGRRVEPAISHHGFSQRSYQSICHWHWHCGSMRYWPGAYEEEEEGESPR